MMGSFYASLRYAENVEAISSRNKVRDAVSQPQVPGKTGAATGHESFRMRLRLSGIVTREMPVSAPTVKFGSCRMMSSIRAILHRSFPALLDMIS